MSPNLSRKFIQSTFSIDLEKKEELVGADTNCVCKEGVHSSRCLLAMQVSFAEHETHYRSAALPHFMPNSILQVLTSRPPQGLYHLRNG